MNGKITNCVKRDEKMYETLLSTFHFLEENEYTRYNVSNTMKRYIKKKEKFLDRTCRKIFIHRNEKGVVYMFANFCKNYDKLIVTLGYYNPNINVFITMKD